MTRRQTLRPRLRMVELAGVGQTHAYDGGSHAKESKRLLLCVGGAVVHGCVVCCSPEGNHVPSLLDRMGHSRPQLSTAPTTKLQATLRGAMIPRPHSDSCRGKAKVKAGGQRNTSQLGS